MLKEIFRNCKFSKNSNLLFYAHSFETTYELIRININLSK